MSQPHQQDLRDTGSGIEPEARGRGAPAREDILRSPAAAPKKAKQAFTPLCPGQFDMSHPILCRIYRRLPANILAYIHFLLQASNPPFRHQIRSWNNHRWVRCTLDALHSHSLDVHEKTLQRALEQLCGKTGKPAVLLRDKRKSHDRASWFAIDYQVLQSILDEEERGCIPASSVDSGPEESTFPMSSSTGQDDQVDEDTLATCTGTESPDASGQNGLYIKKEREKEEKTTVKNPTASGGALTTTTRSARWH